MLTKTTILTAFAATALADLAAYPAHLIGKRFLDARQTDIDFGSIPGVAEATACISAIVSLTQAIPTPPPELLSLTDVPNPDNICSYTPPASVAPAYSSYFSEFQSWYSAHKGDISSALSQCPQYSTSIDLPNIDMCSTGSSPDGTAAPSGTGVAPTTLITSGSGSGPTGGVGATGATRATGGSRTSTAGGARETGFVGAVVAAAGLLGVVAAL